MVVKFKPKDANNVDQRRLEAIAKPRYYTDWGYWQIYNYVVWGRTCFCYGGPNCYSWGWVMDDFGNATMSETNIQYGIYEAHFECH